MSQTQTQRDRENVYSMAGNIESVAMTNFMCHANLEIKLCPGVNFVVGENGSGKSAILTALCVALGARASKTNRSETGNKGLVKSGANIAKVVVRMRNQGPEAYRPEDFGHTIIVERTISATTGASTLKLKSANGREVASKRVDLQRLLDHFNIDVDNPINVMTQDASRKFLHSGTNKDRYQFFVKAMLLQEIQDSLAFVKDQLVSMDSLIEDKQAEVPELERQQRLLEEEMAQFAELDTQRARAEGLRKRLAWAYVSEAETALQTAEEVVAKQKTQLPRIENAIAAAEEKLKEAESEKSLKMKAMTDFNATSAATVEERKAAMAAATRARKAEDDVRRQVSATQRERDDLQSKAARLTEARETARQTQQRETQAETSAADANVARARAAFEQAKQAYERVKAEELAAVQTAEEARSRCEALATGDEDLVREEREARDGLRRLQAAQSDGLTAFGDKMPALVRAINENARQFSAPPIGPLGAHLRLSDSRWGMVVEEAISNMLTTFLVASPADGRVLQGLATKVGMPQQSVLAMNTLSTDRLYDMPPARLPDPSLTTLLRVLSSDRPQVLNALIDNAHIESVVLCEDQQLARRIAWRKNDAPSRNVTEVYTPDGVKLWLKGHSEFTLSRQRSGVARISADLSAQIQAAQKTLAELQARRAGSASRRQELEAAQRRAEEAVKAVKKRVQLASSTGKNAKADLDEAESAAANLVSVAAGAAAPDADAFDAELQEVAQEEAELKKSLVTMEEELRDAAKAAAAAKEAAEVVSRNAADVVERSKQLAAEMNAAIEQVEDRRRRLDQLLGVRAEFTNKLAELENDLNAARAHAASEATKAALAARCTREEAEATPMPKLKEGEQLTVARLTSLLSQVEARMAKEAARNKRPFEEVAGDLADASREVKRVKRALTHAMLPAKRMREGLTKRTSLLRKTARMLAHLCSNRFNTHMMQRGHAGRLVVNYQDGEMSLEVQLANTAPGNNGGSVTVTDTKQLSGGERSYTTLSFTLSLNESSDSPFCALDEWDVFMDAVARKVSLDKMMEYAEEHKEKQFILITPQDISAVKPNAYVTIQKLKPARQN